MLSPLVTKNNKRVFSTSKDDSEQYTAETQNILSPTDFSDFDNSNSLPFENQSDTEKTLPTQQPAQHQRQHNKNNLIDRFIPNRKISRLNIAFSNAHQTLEDQILKENKITQDDRQMNISQLYKSHILGLSPQQKQLELYPFKNQNILVYKDQQQKSPLINQQSQFFQLDDNLQNYLFRNTRKIPKVPYKVLDAPALQDDFYLNLIDWSQLNILAVGLSSCVYLWSAQNSKVTKLCDLGISDSVTSVSWSLRGQYLAIGTNVGDVQIWDTNKLKQVNLLKGHTARVGCLAWNSQVLTSGSRDKSILHRDIRQSSNFIQRLQGHKQEVCGLKWSFDEQQLASGGNDNKLFVWSPNSTQPVCKFRNHMAAVKALAWSPHQHGLLVSGGGTADRTIRFWNTLNSVQLNVIDTGSQAVSYTHLTLPTICSVQISVVAVSLKKKKRIKNKKEKLQQQQYNKQTKKKNDRKEVNTYKES
eukprot:TRINITY_DN3748_c0_g1_i2.p1 TRINITY_DN3748_c0_g1~~TRINITY_DN3748_c0_g1_i2.p1  ORF type:complete len:473 (-),score=62.61 TRINITY_DN3748_c0_g1_i2:24-1442(-)